MSLDARIRERLDKQRSIYVGMGHGMDETEEAKALRAVLDVHSPGDGEVREGYCVGRYHPVDCRCDDVVVYRCPVCVLSWANEETQTAPCPTVRAIATAMGVTP